MITLVAALSLDGVIGRDGDLPWRLPDDLKRFKRLTMGCPMIMGRRTWDSIGRPLPGRRTLVLSRRPGFEAPGAEVFADLDAALAAAADAPAIIIAGGEAVYALAARVVCSDHTIAKSEQGLMTIMIQEFPVDRERALAISSEIHAEYSLL